MLMLVYSVLNTDYDQWGMVDEIDLGSIRNADQAKRPLWIHLWNPPSTFQQLRSSIKVHDALAPGRCDEVEQTSEGKAFLRYCALTFWRDIANQLIGSSVSTTDDRFKEFLMKL